MPLVELVNGQKELTQEFWAAGAECKTEDDWQPLIAAMYRELSPSISEEAVARISAQFARIKVQVDEDWVQRQAMNAEEREADDRENAEWLRRYYADQGKAIPWVLADGRGTCCAAA